MVVEFWVVGVPDDGGVVVSVVIELVHAVRRGLYIYKYKHITVHIATEI